MKDHLVITMNSNCSAISLRCLNQVQRLFGTFASQPVARRDARFMTVTEKDVQFFKSTLGESSVITNATDIQPLNVDWMRRFIGSSTLALKPKTTEQVSTVMQYCNQHKLPIVPQGGNTGLVGGSVPVFDEIILNLSDMNHIQSFDISTGVVVAQAGTVLETLDAHVASAGFRVPLDLGAKGTCQIGGNVATNAGGTRFIRYGSLRSSVLGLEAVLPDGRILDTLTTMRKDNTGYDLKQLMIGSEGTLGVVTRVAIACASRSAAINSVLLRIDSFDRVAPLLQIARHKLAEILSAFEYMDTECINLAAKYLKHVDNPLPDDKATYQSSGGLILIECASSNHEHIRQKLDDFLKALLQDEIVTNGIIAENDAQRKATWKFRESLSGVLLKAGTGGLLKYDISLPLHAFSTCIQETRQRVQNFHGVSVAGWGHIGDGNLHLNIAAADPKSYASVVECMEPWIFEFVQMNRGSVSSEHGLGVMKADAIGYSKGPVAVDVMRFIKRGLDPNGICNPYKMFPNESSQ